MPAKEPFDALRNLTDGPEASFRIEQTEIAAWKDLIDAASPFFKQANGLQWQEVGGGLAINFIKMPVPLFNRVIGLGLLQPLTSLCIEEIKLFYGAGEKYLVHYSAPMLPDDAESLLVENGFYLAGSWERVVRRNHGLEDANSMEDGIEVKQVDENLVEDWVRFLMNTYEFDFPEWPRAFAFRKGWKHYLAMREGKIVACRSFFLTPQKTIFSGVDAPVPGVMTADCRPDFAIWRQAVKDGLRAGAALFVADIELPDKEKNKDAYLGFREMGFEIPYTRFHYRLNK